jgi:hypothetical protein
MDKTIKRRTSMYVRTRVTTRKIILLLPKNIFQSRETEQQQQKTVYFKRAAESLIRMYFLNNYIVIY